MPTADPGRWSNFGERAIEPGDLPPGLRLATDALRAKDLTLALSCLYEVLDSEPDHPAALHEMGVLYFHLQRYGDAVVVLERFLRHVPKNLRETGVLGHCYYSLGDYEKARAHYARILEQAPNDVSALQGSALSSMRLGEGPRALELLQQVVEIEPQRSDAFTWIAQILFDADRSEQALKAAERARDLDPYQPRPWFLLGKILLDLGMEKEGEAAATRYRELNVAAQAIRSLETQLLYAPHQVPVLVRLVELHRSVGNLEKVRESLARILLERPKSLELHVFALDVLEAVGDVEGSSLAAQSLEQSCPDEAPAWKRLEAYYSKAKNRLKEVQAGERYRRLKPD